MEEDKVETRQTLIVYILMGLFATAGLLWALWRHGVFAH